MKTTTVEINGRVYDVKTGQPVDASAKKKSKGQALDGIKVAKPTNSPAHAITKPKSVKKPHTLSAHARRRPAHSSTLHRKAVRKPQLKVASADVTPPVTKKTDDKRLERAKQIRRSGAIKRFNTTFDIKKPVASRPLPVVAALSASPELTPAQPAKNQAVRESLVHATTARAEAHKKHRRIRITHFMRYAVVALVLLVAGGYTAYLNVPAVSMKLAARSAGFDATLPRYKPSGYSLKGPVMAAGAGKIDLVYNAKNTDRQFVITQQPSTWDSSALLENYVLSHADQPPFTYLDRGLTIYMYNNSSAAWVSGGKFYNIDGKNAELDFAELRNIAASM